MSTRCVISAANQPHIMKECFMDVGVKSSTWKWSDRYETLFDLTEIKRSVKYYRENNNSLNALML